MSKSKINTFAALIALINTDCGSVPNQPGDVRLEYGNCGEGKRGRDLVTAFHALPPVAGDNIGLLLLATAVRNPKDSHNGEGEQTALARMARLRAAIKVTPTGHYDFSEVQNLPELLRGEIDVAPFVVADNVVNSMFARVSINRVNGVSLSPKAFDYFPFGEYIKRAYELWTFAGRNRSASKPKTGNEAFDTFKLVARTERALGNFPLSSSLEKVDHFWNRMVAQAKINLEEAKEILEAAEARDLRKLRDGTADNLYTLGGVVHLGRLKIYADLRATCESNLSKLDTSIEDAEQTLAYYQEKGLQVAIEKSVMGEMWLVRVTEDCTDKAGKFFPKGKYVKSVINFHEPRFAPDAREAQGAALAGQVVPEAAGSDDVKVA